MIPPLWVWALITLVWATAAAVVLALGEVQVTRKERR
jgi:hypothetical protein